MNDAEERFAERIAEDLARIVGPGITVDDVELTVGDGAARVTATLRYSATWSRRSRQSVATC